MRRRLWTAAYALVVLLFLRHLASLWLAYVGFTPWIQFGSLTTTPPLRMLENVDFFVHDNWGYDGQYYAQMACNPDLSDPELRRSIDNLPYRARRILGCWVASLMGGGAPWWTLQAYALQPVLAWLGLAVLLLRWYPPGSLDHGLRWSLTLLSWGLVGGIYQTVPDGPALLLIVAALMLLERGRRGWALLLVGLAGLTRETSLLALVMFLPRFGEGRRRWLLSALEVLLGALPLVLWLTFLKWGLQLSQDAGTANFAFPGQGWWGRLQEVWALDMQSLHAPLYLCTRLAFVALTLQALVVMARPRLNDSAWRLGAVHVGLMLLLGEAVWEGHPGAALRVLLPLTLVFNRLVPRGRGGMALLLLGNLSCAVHVVLPRQPERPGLTLRHHLHREVQVKYNPHWVPSRTRQGLPRCSTSRIHSEILLMHRGSSPLSLEWTGRLRCSAPARVSWELDGVLLWHGEVGPDEVSFRLPRLLLGPGQQAIQLQLDAPPGSWLHLIDHVVEVKD